MGNRCRRNSYAMPYHRHLLASIVIGVGAALVMGISLSAYTSPGGDESVAQEAIAPADGILAVESRSIIVVQAPPEKAEIRQIRGTLRSGQTLSASLSDQGVNGETIELVSRTLAPVFDFRRSQPGHSYLLEQEETGRVLDFRYRTSKMVTYRMRLDGDAYSAAREEAELHPRPARIAGVVSTNLYDAVRSLGENADLASQFADIFAWDMDFSRSVHGGDEFRILYERLYTEVEDGRSVYVRPGRILAAHYSGIAGEHTALYFEGVDGTTGGYYRADGSSVQGQFLKAPLRYARISSRYSTARHHPILKVTRPHYGIDYAAPVGTPVWAVADGEVIYKGPAGGFGNLVKVRHARGYVSYYAHLSRFIGNLKVGQNIRQKQLIGYVGDTGLATGPHVCFRVSHDGRYVNPVDLRSPTGVPIEPGNRHAFYAARDGLLALMNSGTLLSATEEAL